MNGALFKLSSSESAIAILRESRVFITSPLDLNDPFEMRPAWTQEHEAKRHDDECLKEQMIAGMRVVVATKDGPIPGGRLPAFKPPPKMEVDSMVGIADEFNRQVFAHLHENYRILSLVEALFDISKGEGESDEDATLMWSHYGDHFQGICLALNPEHIPRGICAGGLKVNYPPERPVIPKGHYGSFASIIKKQASTAGYVIDPESEHGLEIPIETARAKLEDHVIKLLTSKSPAWKYERERRMIYRINEVKSSSSYRTVSFPCENCKKQGKAADACSSPSKRDAVALPPQAIKAVIFGVDCLPSDVETVFGLLKRPEFEAVETYWTAIHSSRYAVQYIQRDESYIRTMQQERAKQTAMAKRHWKNGELVYGRKGVNFDFSDPRK